MNWLFLRGKMERPKECSWHSLDECTDMWTHLFAEMVNEDDMGMVFYSNGTRSIMYKKNFGEVWVNSFKKPGIYGKPDIIVARGGFKEYVPLLKKYPEAIKVYYGANHGCIPKDGIKYSVILCDSPEQALKCKERGLNGKLFFKPAAPHFFPRTVDKKYDVGYSAIWPKDKRKNVSWVHKTAPKELKILQMGHNCKSPSNFSVKYISSDRMPRAISKCKVIIAPYTSEDSCPRIIPEALACGVPVIALKSCQFWKSKYSIAVKGKDDFWDTVKTLVKKPVFSGENIIRQSYKRHLNVKEAADHLRSIIV